MVGLMMQNEIMLSYIILSQALCRKVIQHRVLKHRRPTCSESSGSFSESFDVLNDDQEEDDEVCNSENISEKGHL